MRCNSEQRLDIDGFRVFGFKNILAVTGVGVGPESSEMQIHSKKMDFTIVDWQSVHACSHSRPESTHFSLPA